MAQVMWMNCVVLYSSYRTVGYIPFHTLCLWYCRSPEESSDLCKAELQLLEYCLKVNPKAYSIWLHRQWVMTHGPSPDWAKEKSLCDIFLKYDERNCESWDFTTL